MTTSQKIMISWVGLRGAVPVTLATFPLMAGIKEAHTIFNIVFFIVVVSVLIQGTLIPVLSKMLKLNMPLVNKRNYPIEFEKTHEIDADLLEAIIPEKSLVIGKKISELGVPEKCLVVLLCRNDKYQVPSGRTILESNDILLVLSNKEDFKAFVTTINTIQM